MSKKISIFLILFFMNAMKAFSHEPVTELALFEQIPMVITPSRKLQKITESPASVYVITQEDIKQSGSIHLWDVLRDVPGMDVATSTRGQGEASMRGFNDLGSNKTLLLLDGRSVYLPLQGVLMWELLPVQLEEIDRIEVVKGPVASLYGANANLGLINIITKKPKQLDGTTLSLSGGSRDTLRDGIIFAQDKEDMSYKVSAGWSQERNGMPRGRDALDMARANFYVDHQINDDSSFSLSGGVAKGDEHYFFSQVLSSDLAFFGPIDQTMTYLKSDYQIGKLKSRVYWNYYNAHWETGKFTTDIEVNSADLEEKYEFELNERNSLIIGGGTHFDLAKTDLFPEEDGYTNSQLIWDGFIQDDFKINEKWAFNASTRADHYPRSGFNPSARAALLYYPNAKDTYRVSMGYSFRNPTLTEYFVNLPIAITGFAPLTASFLGNSDVRPETFLTYEFSYQSRRLGGRLRPFIDLYATEFRGIIESVPTGGGPLGLDQQFKNQGKAYSVGGELGAEYDLNRFFTVIANYAHNHVDYDAFRYQEHFHPKNKINGGFKLKFLEDRLSTKLMAHYVSEGNTTIGGLATIPSYTTVDLSVGYQINKNVDVSVAGRNLTGDTHQEAPGGDEIGRDVLGKLDIRF